MSRIEKQDTLNLIKGIHEQSKDLALKKNVPARQAKLSESPDRRSSFGKSALNPEHKQIFFNDISDAMTGFARIIKYVNHSVIPLMKQENMEDSGRRLINMEPKNLEIIQIEEGQMQKGMKHGYNRILSAEDGSCSVGFFYEDIIKGKHCKYNLDGTFDQPEGLYDGGKCSTKIQIANYMQKITR